jgi:hypothetical protein
MFARVCPSVPLIPAATGSFCQSDDLRLPVVCCRPQPKPANPTGLTLADAVRYRQFGEGEPNAVNSILFSRIIVKKGRFSWRCMCLVGKGYSSLLAEASKPNWVNLRRYRNLRPNRQRRTQCIYLDCFQQVNGEKGRFFAQMYVSGTFSHSRFDGLAAYRFPATDLPAVGKGARCNWGEAWRSNEEYVRTKLQCAFFQSDGLQRRPGGLRWWRRTPASVRASEQGWKDQKIWPKASWNVLQNQQELPQIPVALDGVRLWGLGRARRKVMRSCFNQCIV